MKKLKSLVGKKVGRLTVLRRDEEKKGHYYICKCDCGNSSSVRHDTLKKGIIKSCGCWLKEFNKLNLKNKRFSRLLVVKEAPKRKGRTRWLCQCDCGNVKEIDTRHLTRDGDGTRSCGCLLKEHLDNSKLSYGEASFHRLLSLYKRGAKSRNFEFNLSDIQFKKLTKENCHYCGRDPKNTISGKTYYGEYIYNGVDRVDNNKGYTLDNCVSCCCICNKMKMKLSVDDFLDRIKKIYMNHFHKL